jgi:cytochrome c oxidase subunit II
VLVLPLVVAGCGDHAVFDPADDGARRIAVLGWVMIVVSTAITLVVFALLGFGLLRRRREPGRRRWAEDRVVVAGGVILPVVVLLPLSAAAVAVLNVEVPSSELRIEVVGHQFWWELRYPDAGVETANEIHVPVGTPVELVLTSEDVIHSFWVPQLGGKQDLVPGRTNTLRIEAEEPGTYRGQCAEFCGLQHAKMAMLVIAEPPDEFEAWLRDQQDPADPPGGADAAAGLEVLESEACAGCHTVRGTEADGVVGPDLTHLADRRTLAAAVLPNTPDDLRRWLDDTWDVKDGATMPPVPLDEGELNALVAYLAGLR